MLVRSAVVVPVGASGEVCLSTLTDTEVIVDLTGWFDDFGHSGLYDALGFTVHSAHRWWAAEGTPTALVLNDDRRACEFGFRGSRFFSEGLAAYFFSTVRTVGAQDVSRGPLSAAELRDASAARTKDGGTLASRWGLQRAQVELLEAAAELGIRISFFHGRGGSASRGGTRIMPALMASPRGSVGGTFRVTEQGEVIHRKYGIRALALRNLEQATGAVLRATLRPRPGAVLRGRRHRGR